MLTEPGGKRWRINRAAAPGSRSDAEEVARGLKEGRMVLVDVREPNETAVERFPGAVLVPLSAFDPATIPAPPGAKWCSPAAPAAAR